MTGTNRGVERPHVRRELIASAVHCAPFQSDVDGAASEDSCSPVRIPVSNLWGEHARPERQGLVTQTVQSVSAASTGKPLAVSHDDVSQTIDTFRFKVGAAPGDHLASRRRYNHSR
jgi:hypothetical protein